MVQEDASRDAERPHQSAPVACASALRGAELTDRAQWLHVFPQVVSRITHKNGVVWKELRQLMATMLVAYTDHALWQMVALLKASEVNQLRADRCRKVFSHAKVRRTLSDGTDARRTRPSRRARNAAAASTT